MRRDIANSSIHDRDGRAGVGSGQMPPLARNVPDQRILALYDQWVNYAFDVLNITRLTATSVRLKFDRAVETVSATTPTNYAISDGQYRSNGYATFTAFNDSNGHWSWCSLKSIR